eukprot:Skav223173  [mRNA]  locus=scaffold2044:126582:127331:+ [translate_table: standard]
MFIRSRGILRAPQNPDSRLLVIFLGLNHVEIESVKAVQETIQSTDPDAICVEPCKKQDQEHGLVERAHMIRKSSKALFRQDVAKNLRRDGHQGRRSNDGLELIMAFPEAHRFLKPCYLVDRNWDVTKKRFDSAPGVRRWHQQYFPRLTKVLDLIRVFLATQKVNGDSMVPETQLLNMFHRRKLHLPWQLREEVLKPAEPVSHLGRDKKMVPLDCLSEALSEGRIQSTMSVGRRANATRARLPTGCDSGS